MRKPAKREDMNETAYRVMQEVIKRSEEEPPRKVVPITTRQTEPVVSDGKILPLLWVGWEDSREAKQGQRSWERSSSAKSASKAAHARWSRKPELVPQLTGEPVALRLRLLIPRQSLLLQLLSSCDSLDTTQKEPNRPSY